MAKNKYALGGVIGLVVLGAAGGGFLWWQDHHHASLSFDARQTAAMAAANGTSGPISLNQTNSKTDASGGLSVGSGSPTGQLGGNQSQSSQGQSGSGASNAPAIDPSAFAQYDKYKSSTSALFGDVQAGNGDTLTNGKKAAVYYKGWLTNGTLFDESRPGSDGQLQPFVFQLGAHQVIPGWEEGLAGMKAGGTRLLIVPPAAGYGAAGQGPVPGNAVMVFEVQLLAVQ